MVTGIVIFFLSELYFEKSPFEKADKLTPVSVVKVIRSNLCEEITLSAELIPYQKATLYAKVSGYLKTINVDIGDQVKSGQILAQLEVPELKNDLANNKARYDEAKLEYDRISAVPKKHPGLIAQEDVDKARAAYEMAEASFEHAKTLLNFSTLTAPYDGVITKRFVDEGALIQIGTSSSTQAHPVVEVAENKKLRLVFPVPESIVTKVNPGNKAEIIIQSTGEKLKGVIARTADKVDTDTRTMRAEIDFDNKDFKFKPGMYAFVKLFLEEQKDSIAIPIQAVEMGKNPNVWVVNAARKIEKRFVSLGLQTPNLVGITKGVKEGELIIFGNRDLLKIGMNVAPKIITAPIFQEN